jgi:hypothetical protein
MTFHIPLGVRVFDTWLLADEWLRASGYMHISGTALGHFYAKRGEAQWSMKLTQHPVTRKFEVQDFKVKVSA